MLSKFFKGSICVYRVYFFKRIEGGDELEIKNSVSLRGLMKLIKSAKDIFSKGKLNK